MSKSEKPAEKEATVTPAEDGGVHIDFEQPAGLEIELAPPEKTPAPAGPTERVETVETPPETPVETKPAAPTNEAVEELRSQLQAASDREAAANREKIRAEQLAAQRAIEVERLNEETRRAHDEALDSRRSQLDSGISASKAEADGFQRQYQSALEAGDFAAASKINVELNRAVSKMVVLESEKASFESQIQRQSTASGRIEAAPPQQQLADPVEQYVQSMPPRTQSWLRKHMECVTDKKMSNKTASAHYDALAEGHVQDSDSYFDYIDRKLGFSPSAKPQAQQLTTENEASPPASKPKPQKAAAPAAPVSRETPRSQESSNSRIYLNRSELEMAEALGLTPAEYGKRKQAMQKQGFYQ